MLKKVLAIALSTLLVLSLVACGQANQNSATKTDNNSQAAAETTVEKVEVNQASTHMDSFQASTSGQWEAMFVPVDVPNRSGHWDNIDLKPTADELAAMQKEPAYGKPFTYILANGCSAGCNMADALGYFKEAGLTAEGLKGAASTEALGTGQADVVVEHLATLLVPITNGVDIVFTGGAHIGCKSLYVLKDSKYNSTKDLKGTTIAVPSGIGSFDYNITCCLLDQDGMNPLKDVTLTPVATDACLSALERGEISAALLSDGFAYSMIKEGKLKCIRSLLDTDFANKNCCMISMNGTFVKNNPTIAKKITQAVQKAHCFMRDKPEEATKFMLEKGFNVGDFDKNLMLNKSLQFGTSDEFAEASLKDMIARYVRLGLITTMTDEQEILNKAWHPFK